MCRQQHEQQHRDKERLERERQELEYQMLSGYGTVIATYAYFVLTKEEYILNDVKNRQQLLIMHKKAKKLGADLAKYNQWQSEIHKIEYKLNKLRNPLKLHLPKKSPSVVEDKPITQPDIQKPATNVEQPTKKTDVEQ
ncbi:hypothetical protein HUJ04_007523 [Dendroctonus ponderosae]|nr:hypothetical protein HUJ04_007523 [Dendroctonus ponderosae]